MTWFSSTVCHPQSYCLRAGTSPAWARASINGSLSSHKCGIIWKTREKLQLLDGIVWKTNAKQKFCGTMSFKLCVHHQLQMVFSFLFGSQKSWFLQLKMSSLSGHGSSAPKISSCMLSASCILMIFPENIAVN